MGGPTAVLLCVVTHPELDGIHAQLMRHLVIAVSSAQPPASTPTPRMGEGVGRFKCLISCEMARFGMSYITMGMPVTGSG